MKNQKIKSILGSVMLVSFALAPLSSALADDNKDAKSFSVTGSAKVEVGGGEGDRASASLNGEGDSKDNSSSDSVSQEGDSKDGSSSDSLSNQEGDSKDSSSSDSLSEGDSKDASSSERENEKEGEKFKKENEKARENILKTAERLGQSGSEIKSIVEDQASSSEAIVSAVSKVEARGALQTFLLGADYKNLGQLVSEVAKTQDRLDQLDNQVSKMASSSDKAAVLTNIQSLKDQTAKLQTFISDNTNKFSLFGWLVKLLGQN